MTRIARLALLLWLAASPSLAGAPSTSGTPGAGRPAASPAAVQTRSLVTFEANELAMDLTNYGAFAFDPVTFANWGLRYPRGSAHGVIFAAGLWLGAMVGTAPRVTVAEYSQEYTPGSAVGGIPEPALSQNVVYTLQRTYPTPTDAALALESYNNNALSRGAPIVTQLPDGSLSIPGDVMSWSVFNDLDQLAHTNPIGSTNPLQIEVQQTTWAYDRPGPFGSTIFTRFKLVNRGPILLQDMYVGLWCDPDLGNFADDRVGSVSTQGLGYCYNGGATDLDYGATPPAVGFDLLQGPFSTQLGARLSATSIVAYTNGTDPKSFEETYNALRGLHPNGTPIEDPELNVTKFQYSGDPVAGTGWLDPADADKRFLLASGPITMPSGAQQEIVLAIIVARGQDRLQSVRLLQSYDQLVQTAFDTNQLGLLDAPSPGAARLSLGRTFPNPARDRVTVSFTLPASGRAELELVDVAGRRAGVLDLGELAPGPHTATLAARTAPWPAGMYFLRLNHGVRTVSSRVVVLP